MMTPLPSPFVTALLMVLLAASNHQQLKGSSTGRVFALFLYLNAVSMVCIGFRWSHELMVLLPVSAGLSVISSSLLYLAFCSLGRHGPVIAFSRDWAHLLPIGLFVLVLLIQPWWIESVLIATKIVYAGLLLQLARRAPVSLQFVRFSGLSSSRHALWGSAALLLLSVGVDVAIAIDFARYEGRHAARLVGFVNLAIMPLLGWASVMAGRGKGLDVQSGSSDTPDNVGNTQQDASTDNTFEDGAQILQQLNQLLIDQRLYADTELNLQKLARKAGVSARIVSRSVNAYAGMNVSQWINSARVDAVCELLKDKDVSVTQAMHDAGFLTKSNFNREFRRLKGCNPSQWRTEHSCSVTGKRRTF